MEDHLLLSQGHYFRYVISFAACVRENLYHCSLKGQLQGQNNEYKPTHQCSVYLTKECIKAFPLLCELNNCTIKSFIAQLRISSLGNFPGVMASLATKAWGSGKEFWGMSWDYDPQWTLNEKQKEIQGKLIECCRTLIRPNAVSYTQNVATACCSRSSTISFSLTALYAKEENLIGLLFSFVCPSCFRVKSLFNHTVRN